MSIRSDKLRARWANPEMRARLLAGIQRAKSAKKQLKQAATVEPVEGQLPANTLVTWYDEYVPPKVEGLPGTYFKQRYGRLICYIGNSAEVLCPKFPKPVIEKVSIGSLEEVKH